MAKKEKEAGFAILNELHGAKGVKPKKAKEQTPEPPKVEAAKQQQKHDEWLSIWNDALFH